MALGWRDAVNKWRKIIAHFNTIWERQHRHSMSTGWWEREKDLDPARRIKEDSQRRWECSSDLRMSSSAERPFVVVVQSLSLVQLFATPWTAARHVSRSFTISWSLLKFMSIESALITTCILFYKWLEVFRGSLAWSEIVWLNIL